MKKLWILGLAAGFGLTGLTAQASVVTLDWNNVTQGTLSKSGSAYTDVINLNGGQVKVTETFTGGANATRFGTSNIQTPAVTNTVFQGGLAPGSSNLSTVSTFTSTGSLVTFTIDFLGGFKQGVSNVNFSLFDVDSNDATKFVDQVTFKTGGLTLVGSKDNVVTGNTVTGVKAASNFGAGSADGNVKVSSGNLPLKEIVFTYGSTGPNPSLHGLGLGNISFTPVPEVGQLAIGLAACALGVLALRNKRSKLVAA